MSCSLITPSDSTQMLKPQSALAQSSYPAHRIAFAALKALARYQVALENHSTQAPSSLWQECEALVDPTEKLHALKIIQLGLKKHDLIQKLGTPTEWIQDCNRSVEEKIQSIALRNKNSPPIASLSALFQALQSRISIPEEDIAKHLEISNYCINCLQNIHRESYGLHVSPSEIVDLHKSHLTDRSSPTQHISHILKSLATLRQCIRQCRSHTEAAAREHYTNCLHELNEYLSTQIEDLSMEMLETLNPETPELLEILWAITEKTSETPIKTAFLELKTKILRGIHTPSSSEEVLGQQIEWAKNHTNDLTNWLYSGYSLTPQREQEVMQSLNHYERYTRKLEVQKADAIVKRNFG